MDYILKRFCPNLEFDSYEDFCRNFTINVPECFNFGYDVVDEWARVEPDKLALLWTDDAANMRSYTFADVSRISNQAANFFQSHGIKKGDVVMLILKQRPEVWFSMVGLCKLGAVCIPATYQLTPKDISYRCNAADVKMIASVADEEIVGHIINALPACNQRPIVATLGPCSYAEHGFLNYSDELYRQDIQWQRPTGKDATTNDDCMLI